MPLVKPSRWRPFLKEPAKKVLESVAQEQGSSGAEALHSASIQEVEAEQFNTP